MFTFFQCVAESVVENGVRGLVEMIPGGAFALAVAGSALAKYKAHKHDEALRSEVAQMAAAGVEEARQVAVEAVKAVSDRVPIEDRLVLESYLAQIPAAVSQSLKRPADPTGKTVPSSFALTTPDDVLRLLPPRPPRFQPGATLPGQPEWRLEKVLGVGGFGEVWLARHQALGLETAVKFCHGPQAADLRHESQVIAQVMRAGRHPSVVTLLDAVLTGDTPWLRFEYVEGGDLGDWTRILHKQPVDQRPKHVIHALRQVSTAVGAFHRLTPPVVHRDLKPSNILFDKADRKLRVTDFGIGAVAAKATLAEEARGAATASGRMLSSHRGSHTPLYASPQQRAGSDPDPRDDVHALGVIGYQLLTGRLDQGPGTDYAHDLGDLGAPAGLIDLIGRCVSQNPNRRPATAADVATELATLATPATPASVVVPPAPPPAVVPPPVVVPPVPSVVVEPPVAIKIATSTDEPTSKLKSAELPDLPAATEPQASDETKEVSEREVDVPVSGSWKMNRVVKPFANWRHVTKLPARVKVRSDQIYALVINRGARDANVQGIANLVGVNELLCVDLIGCKRLGSEGFAQIAKLTQILTLLLHESAITDTTLKLFATLSKLENLSLGQTGITNAGLTHLKPLRALGLLSLTGTGINDAGLSELASLRNLVSLELNGTKITDAGLATLGALSRLESISLATTSVTDDGVSHLLRLSKLQTLQLSGTALTDIGIAQLATMKKLEWLGLSGCKALTDRSLMFLSRMPKLGGLDLGGTAITDAGIAQLKTASKLTELSLEDCPGVTDVGVAHLVAMQQLEAIHLKGTGITAAGIERLVAALPDTCTVYSDLVSEMNPDKPTSEAADEPNSASDDA